MYFIQNNNVFRCTLYKESSQVSKMFLFKNGCEDFMHFKHISVWIENFSISLWRRTELKSLA
jgi:hypothetical protein